MSDAFLMKAFLKSLLPEGKAWQLEEGGDFDLLLEGLAENWSDVKSYLDLLAYVRDPWKTPVLEDLEWDYGFLTDPSLDEKTRRRQLAAFIYDDPEAVGSDDDLEELLNNSGFDVKVHQNDPAVDPSMFLGDILLNGKLETYYPEFMSQCGHSSMVCGNINACCGRFDSFGTTVFSYTLPVQPIQWPLIFFVGGPAVRDQETGALTFIAPAEVPLHRKNKFIDLILKSKNFPSWAVLVVNYTSRLAEISGLKFDLNVAEYATQATLDESQGVVEFRDNSGEGVVLFQENSDSRPILQKKAINGRPALRFDGVDDYLDFNKLVTTSTGNFTTYLIVRFPDDITVDDPGGTLLDGTDHNESYGGHYGRLMFSIHIYGLNAASFLLRSQTSPDYPHGYLNTSMYGYITSSIASGVSLLSMRVSGGVLDISLNGVSQNVYQTNNGVGSTTFGPNRSLVNIRRLGAGIDVNNGTAISEVEFDFARMAYWDRALTESEDAIVTEILTREWL